MGLMGTRRASYEIFYGMEAASDLERISNVIPFLTITYFLTYFLALAQHCPNVFVSFYRLWVLRPTLLLSRILFTVKLSLQNSSQIHPVHVPLATSIRFAEEDEPPILSG